ncbi:MAG: DUF2851 family protein [Pedobacter sp.]|nr:DUF2851 family protein [Pedobacter sp.]MDQ8053252.1 DUF2851 family protein [Pedobacter sp.]
MNFPEEFLHFIWRFKLFGSGPLFTTNGEAIQLMSIGVWNKNAGPDFSNAKLRIDGTVWAGNIEIHVKGSDWMLHQHQHNDAYENVILHVVYEDDLPIYRKDGSLLPVLVIKGLFPEVIFDHFEALVHSISDFPCAGQIGQVDDFLVRHFLSRVLIERLVQRTEAVAEKLELAKGDWNAVFYHFLARNFGFKVNSLPMEILAQSIPYQLFAKHGDSPLQIEALIFGQAGFLSQKFSEAYPRQLKREYLFLKKKYGLKPIAVSLWKFMRMRPQNFPTLRLAQFSALLSSSQHLFSRLLQAETIQVAAGLFSDLPVHPFWQDHYHFHRQAKNVAVQLGQHTIHNLLINTVSLILFSYGTQMDHYEYVQRAMAFLESLPNEKNAIVSKYIKAGVNIDDAGVSQAIIQLKSAYCDQKKCLECSIGAYILKKKVPHQKEPKH